MGNIVEISTGQVRNGFTLYRFQANIVPVSLSGGTDYWISIYESAGTNGSQYFLWRIIGNTGPRATTSDPNGTWGATPGGGPLAFQLEGISVPEPASLTIASLGALGLIAGTMRRRVDRPALR